MNIEEYNLVKKYDYLKYCDYLKNKYGVPVADYFTKSWNKTRRISRTKDGLVLHMFLRTMQLCCQPRYLQK